MVLYFTGTGNSRYEAERIAQALAQKMGLTYQGTAPQIKHKF